MGDRGDEGSAIEACSAPMPRRREWLLALAAVLVLTDVFDGPLYTAFGFRAMLLPGVPISRLLLLVVFAVAALLLVGDWRRPGYKCHPALAVVGRAA
jgi:hypothetical protein